MHSFISHQYKTIVLRSKIVKHMDQGNNKINQKLKWEKMLNLKVR